MNGDGGGEMSEDAILRQVDFVEGYPMPIMYCKVCGHRQNVVVGPGQDEPTKCEKCLKVSWSFSFLWFETEFDRLLMKQIQQYAPNRKLDTTEEDGA